MTAQDYEANKDDDQAKARKHTKNFSPHLIHLWRQSEELIELIV